MWPTPDAAVSNDGEDLENWLQRREREKAKGRNGNGFGVPVAVAVAARLWPTPTRNDHKNAGYQSAKGTDFPTLPGAAGAAGARGGTSWPMRPAEPWEQGLPRTVLPEKGDNRRARLKALGNAVVPQVAEVIGRVLVELHRHRQTRERHD